MQLTSIVQMTAVDWEKVPVETSIDRKERDFWVLLVSIISTHFKVHFKGYIYVNY